MLFATHIKVVKFLKFLRKSFQKRGFNGYYGVIGGADSEYDIVNNILGIFGIIYNKKANNSSNLEHQG